MPSRHYGSPKLPCCLLAVAAVSGMRAGSTEIEENRGSSAATLESGPALAVRAADPRPSVVLVVIDTLRADAVSSYGVVEGTTPTLDRLAREGVRYARAYAPAPWTVSGHVTIFSGLRVDEHGVGLDGASVAPDSLQMLAETFRDAGYLTAGMSENPLVSTGFGFDQGFDVLEAPDVFEVIGALQAGGVESASLELIERVEQWNRLRDKSLPFFLFVNIFDPHDPYEVRKVNPWIPENVRPDEARFIQSKYPIPNSLCDGVPTKEHLAVLRGLYLGDVAAADAKLEKLLEILDEDGDGDSLLVVATADHGEHLGESRLMGHQFTVRSPALHVPLIVSGLPAAVGAIIERAVEIRQIHHSLLCWALGESCEASLPIMSKSSHVESESPEPIFSIYSDSIARLPEWVVGQLDIPDHQKFVYRARSKCSPQDRVFGEMVSMIRYPMKITWFAENDPVLHDLSWDPMERFDQMESQPLLAAKLREELDEFVRANMTERDVQDLPELSEESVRALKSLGYIE
jgi:hypothetical protein